MVSTIVRGSLGDGVHAVAAGVDQFERGLDVLGCVEHLVDGDRVAAEALADDERHLDLELGIDEVGVTEFDPAGHDHVVEQCAEVGLVDLHLLLHRSRRETDLAADELRSVGDLQVDPRLLHGVGVVDRQFRVLDGDRVDRLDLAACPLVTLGELERELGA